MFLFQSQAKPAPRLSFIWILIYLPLHQFIAQILRLDNAFLWLRVAFMLLVFVVLLLKQEGSQIREICIGRWLSKRSDWIAAGMCLLLVLVTQVFLSQMFHYRKETSSEYFMLAIAAPTNEEILFRGLFLAPLLPHFPRWPFGAVLLTTAIFIGCHDLTNSGWAVWSALATQSIVYGVCYIWTGCVPACIFCHWLWNTLFFI